MGKHLQGKIFIAVCLLGIAYALFQKKQLKDNYVITIGKVKDVEYTSKSTDYFVSYIFPENNGISKSSIKYIKFNDIVFLKILLVNKNFPVVYQKNNPNNNRMLFLEKDYKEYGIVPSQEQSIAINAIDSLLKEK